ncbi:quaternary amine ABC transporter ATP-binding protein [Demequina zhanjiangensis]|uniref:Glycine betaine/L-proline ABC transporter ATP-binding protein n=1 Tax=Demequina zhanjiangensis TaxID=3051659 RepID=A0ABT8G1G7_9MICO|nr:glycine betaine/L-proline ABC transporter ATP-binding protein [Demequina sp. SYSU T00b26]MDN4472967.1 glycine betaine/L-proline ABC transporter ATP-binding protein [Demequina sp. SYSU T00b26]
MNDSIALRAEGLFKVFGKHADQAVSRLRNGTDRTELGSGTTAAVIDASFEVKRGEIFVVMGLSGSGKSTLIRMLNGLHDVTSGTVEIGDDTITDIPAKKLRDIRRKRVSMVFQHFALLPHRTVLDNVAYGLEIQGMTKADREAKAREVTEIVGLGGWEEKLPSELSGGMQQRVGLARALAADTDVLLMDEAFSALDPLIRREMQEQLLELQSSLGKTIIFITHDLNEAMFLGDRIAVMRDGRIVQIGTPEDILTDPANDYVEQFVADVDRTRVLTAESVMRKPRASVYPTSGPHTALKIMRDEQLSAIYVTKRDRTLVGWITDRAALDLVRKGVTSLESIISEDHGAVSKDTSLADLFIPVVESQLPLAVTDDRGRLVGVIPRVTLLSALGGEADGAIQAGARPDPLPTDVVDQALEAAVDSGSIDAKEVQ